MCPIVVVSCFNQLALLELQAQSISKHLKGKHDIFIIVNELDTAPWDSYFKERIEHYYANHTLHILHVKDFDIQESPKYYTASHKWAGWDVQQILKLAIAEHISGIGYLVLDSQNFLIKDFSTQDYIVHGLTPMRRNKIVMPEDTWHTYNKELGLDLSYPTTALSICTPIFLDKDIVQSLIESKQTLYDFSVWFNSTATFKSEFMLYDLWMQYNGQEHLHYEIELIEDWANPYLRDSNQFDADFEVYLANLGKHEPHKWSSINYRAWGSLNDTQYQQLKTKLANFSLVPAMDNFRLTYNQT